MDPSKVTNRELIRIMCVVTIFVAILFALFRASQALIWIFISFFLALAMTPAVNRLQKHMPKKSRGLATGLFMFVVIVISGILFLIIVPPLINQMVSMISDIPKLYQDFISSNTAVANYIASHKSTTVNNLLTPDNIKHVTNFVVNFFGGVISGIFATVTIVTFTFFMLLEGPRWHAIFLRYQPRKRRTDAENLMKQMHETVTGYVNGNLFTSLIASVTAAIMLLLINTPYVLALSVMVGIINLIPMIGSTLSAVIVSIFVLITGGFWKALISATFFLVYQLIENSYLQNVVYSRAVQVSPLVVGISALLGGYMAGFLGALVAIPAAASLQILAKYYLNKRIK